MVLSGDEPIPGDRTVASLVPFGLGQRKPHPYRAAARAAWRHRRELRFTWRLLRTGVCEGCALAPRGLRDDVVARTHLCEKRLDGLSDHAMGSLAPADLLHPERLARLDEGALRRLGRLPAPFVRRSGRRGFEQVGWDDALALVGQRVGEVPPERQAWLAGATGSTNEALFCFARAADAVGVANLDILGIGEVGAALRSSLGTAASTCSFADLVGTDLVLLFGAGLADGSPVLVEWLATAKRTGTRVVVVDRALPVGLRRAWIPGEPLGALFGATVTDDFVAVRDGGIAPFVAGVLRALVERDGVAHDHIERFTEGWAEVAGGLAGWSWEALEAASGARRADMEWVGGLVARSRSMVGVLDAGAGAAAAGVVIDLHLATGMIGQLHRGVLWLGGPANGQGGLDFGVRPGPGGWSADRALQAAASGDVDLVYAMDARLPPDSVAGVAVRVHQGPWLDRAMLAEPGEVVVLLPTRTRHEQARGGTVTSAERRVRFAPEVAGHRAPREARAEWRIPPQVAAAALPGVAGDVEFADTAAVRVEMERVVPSYRGLAELAAAGDWIQWGGPLLHAGGRFDGMPHGKARFAPVPDRG